MTYIYQTILEWEECHNKEYPDWAQCWSYDAYGECWEIIKWKEIKQFYIEERKNKQGLAAWDFQYEPIVADPSLPKPKWGEGKLLIRNNIG
ncbi:MAG: hypothetical protein PHC28_04795 [Flavobacterium sp.]|uniref:hypothetical protein n=1 Tax=Flavobacterium sp. TaxID=239 RepID=UPI002621BEAA|nr:hypothetical protein [Flavobacterium sp.]MDD5149783.1 hypothetical protein [Flavobacterium sp.]